MESLRRTPSPFSLALLVHGILLGIVMLSFSWTPRSKLANTYPPAIVQAIIIDKESLLAKLDQQQKIIPDPQKTIPSKLKAAEQQAIESQQQEVIKKAQQEVKRQQELEQKKQQEQIRLKQVEAEKKAKEAAQRKVEVEKKQKQAEEQKKQQEQIRLKQVEAEKKAKEAAQRKAEAEKKRKQAEEQKKQQEQIRLKQVEAEKKAKEAAQRKAEIEKKQAEAKRRLEEENRQAEAAKRKEEDRKKAEVDRRKAEENARRQQELQANIDAEQKATQTKVAIEHFIPQLQARVQRYWIRPPGTQDNMVTVLQVELLPTGEVHNVKIVESSGDLTFDRSAQAAVYKASPLPLPTDAAAVAKLQSFNFKFCPGSSC